MFSIRVTTSASMDRFFSQYPDLFEKAKTQATNRALDILQKTSFQKAPYKTGNLRREIKQMYDGKKLVAGTDRSFAYALIQDVGGKAGRNHSVTIRPKHYFFQNAVEQQNNVLNEFVKSFQEIFAKV
jgi:phage gpG-like protein